MFTLIGLGVSVAYGYSVIATFLLGVFPGSCRDQNGQVGLYFEAAAVIVTLVLLGAIIRSSGESSISRGRLQTEEA